MASGPCYSGKQLVVWNTSYFTALFAQHVKYSGEFPIADISEDWSNGGLEYTTGVNGTCHDIYRIGFDPRCSADGAGNINTDLRTLDPEELAKDFMKRSMALKDPGYRCAYIDASASPGYIVISLYGGRYKR